MDICKVSSAPEPVNRCRLCGATGYRRVIERDARGVLVVGSRYACSGCRVTFTEPKAWRPSAATGREISTARSALARTVGMEESAGRPRLEHQQANSRPPWSRLERLKGFLGAQG